jgi:hypothetical protein
MAILPKGRPQRAGAADGNEPYRHYPERCSMFWLQTAIEVVLSFLTGTPFVPGGDCRD